MNSCIRSISSEGGPGGRRGSRGRARAQDRRTGARSRAAVGARACVVDRRAAALGQSLDGLESHEGFDAAEGVDLPSARGNVVSIRLAQGRPPSIGSARAATVVVGGGGGAAALRRPLSSSYWHTGKNDAQCTMHNAQGRPPSIYWKRACGEEGGSFAAASLLLLHTGKNDICVASFGGACCKARTCQHSPSRIWCTDGATESVTSEASDKRTLIRMKSRSEGSRTSTSVPRRYVPQRYFPGSTVDLPRIIF